MLALSAERVRQLVREGKLPVAEHTPLGRLFDAAVVATLARARAAERSRSR